MLKKHNNKICPPKNVVLSKLCTVKQTIEQTTTKHGNVNIDVAFTLELYKKL